VVGCIPRRIRLVWFLDILHGSQIFRVQQEFWIVVWLLEFCWAREVHEQTTFTGPVLKENCVRVNMEVVVIINGLKFCFSYPEDSNVANKGTWLYFIKLWFDSVDIYMTECKAFPKYIVFDIWIITIIMRLLAKVALNFSVIGLGDENILEWKNLWTGFWW